MTVEHAAGSIGLQVHDHQRPAAGIGDVGETSLRIDANVVEIAVPRCDLRIEADDADDSIGGEVHLDELRGVWDDPLETRGTRVEHPQRSPGVARIGEHALHADEAIFGVLTRRPAVPPLIRERADRPVGFHLHHGHAVRVRPARKVDEDAPPSGHRDTGALAIPEVGDGLELRRFPAPGCGDAEQDNRRRTHRSGQVVRCPHGETPIGFICSARSWTDG